MTAAINTRARLLRLVALVGFLLVSVAVFAGCSSSAEDGANASGAPAAQPGDAGDDSVPEPGTPNESAQSRSFIVTGSMYMTVEDPLDAADKAATIVQGAGGRIDARSETAPDEWTAGAAELTLRIPADRLDATVEDLRALGTVDQYTTTAADVTNQVTDLDAHISTLRASTQRIEALLVDAKDITDIIKLEDELASRQAELESLEAQQRGLSDQVSLSTIELSLTTVPVAVVEDESRATFFDGLAAGWNGLVSFVSVALVVLGALLPWLIVTALITFAIVAVIRARRSSAAAREPQPTEPAPVEETPAAEATTVP